MELYNATGVITTPEVRNAKPIASLLIQTTASWSELLNEKITIFVERANGSNTEIATQIPLQDFILLSVYGTSAIYETATYKVNALCELTPELAIELAENEAVKFKIDGLTAGKTYAVNGIEEAASGNMVNRFDRKVALAGEASRRFDVAMYSAVCITNYDDIKELNLTYDNGHVCKYTKVELMALSMDTDPVQQYSVDGSGSNGVATVASTHFTDKIVFPLLGVTTLEIVKTEAEQVNLTFKSEKFQ